MQAVLLAAGKSTRTYPLTLTKPKPLLKVANKTLLEHNLNNLNNIVEEVIIVVGYKKELIKKYFGEKYKNLKIKYVEQKQQLGTGDALLTVEKHIRNDLISLYGDDIYSKNDFENIIKNKYSILVKKVENPELFGAVLQNKNVLINLIEKPQKFVSNLVSAGLYKFDKKIFPLIKNLEKSKRGEYELTDAIKSLALEEKIYCVRSRSWIPIGYPWDLLKADKILRRNKNIIGNHSIISGKVKNSSIGNGCIINGEVKNSIIMDKTIIEKNSIVQNSVIGENVYFSGKIIARNVVYSSSKNKSIKSQRLGAVIGDNVRAENVTIKAGCKIWPYSVISNQTIKQDYVKEKSK